MIIREATPADYENLCSLFNEIDELHRDNLPAWFQKPTGSVRDKDFVLNLLADETRAIFVVENEEELVGLVQIALKTTPPMGIFIPRQFVTVDSLVVKKNCRGQGIGQKLMDKVYEWATSKGATSVELNVYTFNRGAIDFYRNLGYETISYKMGKSLK